MRSVIFSVRSVISAARSENCNLCLLQNVRRLLLAAVLLYDLLLCKRTDNYMVAWGLQQWHHGRADQRCVSVSLGSGLKVLKKLVRIIEASYDYDHHC